MRDARTRNEPISIVLQVPNLNASFETSALVIACKIFRAFGPQTPIVVYEEVRSVNDAVPSSGSRSENHLRSAGPCAPPVTTRK